MRKLAIGGVTLAMILGLVTPVAHAQPSFVQRTLSIFPGNSTSITFNHTRELQRLIEQNPMMDKFICTGIRFVSQPMSENIRVRARAKAACEFVQRIRPDVSVWFQTRTTNVRSFSGRVLVTVKMPVSQPQPPAGGGAQSGADGNQAGFATDDPSVWLTSKARRAGHLCDVEGERIILQGNQGPGGNQGLECRRETLNTFRWVRLNYLEPLSTRANPANPRAGTTCYRQGDRVDNAAGYLECRYLAGMSLQFVQVNGNNDAPTTAAGLVNPEICKIRDQRAVPWGAGATAFPMRYNRMKSSGEVNIAIIPIDFPDSPGRGKPMDWLKPHIEMLDARNSELFDNRIRYNWLSTENWLRMPMNSEYYNQDHSTIQPDGSLRPDGTTTLRPASEQLYDIFTAAEKELNIRQFDMFWIFSNPYAQKVQFGPGYVQDVRTATNYYANLKAYPMGFWGFNSLTIQPAAPKFEGIAHEMQHFHGMVQHAPGNGWGWHQGVATSWETWIAGWRPDSQYACLDATSAVNSTVSLSALDLPSKGFKSLVIKLSNSEVLVVESRRKGLFSPVLPRGFAGITVYKVDATKSGQRWDGNLDRERDYFAYFLRNNRGGYPYSGFGPTLGDQNVIAYQGDSFSYRGITIELVRSADYDTVRVSSAQGVTAATMKDAAVRVIQPFAREPEEGSFCGCCGCSPFATAH